MTDAGRRDDESQRGAARGRDGGEPAVLVWRRPDLGALETVRFQRDGGEHVWNGVTAATASAPGLAAWSVSWQLHLDSDLVPRRLTVEAGGSGPAATLLLEHDGRGGWQLDGAPAPELGGAMDVDLVATVATNTPPMRRLGAAVGQSVTWPVVWVDAPGLAVERVEQTYRRTGEREWDFSARGDDAYPLTVDDDGFVLRYQGVAERV